jgi:dihydroorotate dehydrogenase
MITLSNGHKLEYVAASGALAFDGKGYLHEWPLRWLGLIKPQLFTVFSKTVTYKERKGNLRWYCPWKCIRLVGGFLRTNGTLNAVGLTNKGIKWFGENVGVKTDHEKIALAGSILSDNILELLEMARIMNDFDLVALEINASCPNTGADLIGNTARIIAGCEEVKKISRFPLVLKLSVAHNIYEILPYVRGIVEAISINSVPWKIIFPKKESPLARLGGGGVSGKIAQLFTWKMVEEIVYFSDIPVIGPSVWDFEDIEDLWRIGASAISFGSIFLIYPLRPTAFVKKDMEIKQAPKV